MELLSSYYWQQSGRNVSSLVLLQACHRKKRIPVLLACVCEGGMADVFSDWFYETGLHLCARGTMRGWNRAVKGLEIFLADLREEAEFVGILCAENRFVRFGQGRGEIFLLNTRNFRPNCRAFEKERWETEQGFLQSGIGILLVTEGFAMQMRTSFVTERLDMRGLGEEIHMEQCLKEIGTEFEQKNGRNMGAILIGMRNGGMDE